MDAEGELVVVVVVVVAMADAGPISKLGFEGLNMLVVHNTQDVREHGLHLKGTVAHVTVPHLNY